MPDPASKVGRQLGACWGPGNSLLLHAKKSRTGEQQHGAGGEQARVHEVRWETTLYEPVFRKLVNESLGIFLSLQKLAEEEAGVVADQLVRQSILFSISMILFNCSGQSIATIQERDKRLPRATRTACRDRCCRAGLPLSCPGHLGVGESDLDLDCQSSEFLNLHKPHFIVICDFM